MLSPKTRQVVSRIQAHPVRSRPEYSSCDVPGRSQMLKNTGIQVKCQGRRTELDRAMATVASFTIKQPVLGCALSAS